MVHVSSFAGISGSEFVDIILSQTGKSDEAMYYLLHQRLRHQLRECYDGYQHQLYDDFGDVVEDFFLYLREGRGNRFPYQALRRIKNKDAFENWLLMTFRNYISNRLEAENVSSLTLYSDHGFHGLANANMIATDEMQEQLSDEQRLEIADRHYGPRAGS